MWAFYKNIQNMVLIRSTNTLRWTFLITNYKLSLKNIFSPRFLVRAWPAACVITFFFF